MRAPDGGRAHATQEEKQSSYNQRYVCHEGTTIPFAVETGGLLGGDAERWLRYIARAAAGPAKEHLSAKVRQYYERIAVAVQTGNAYVLRRWMSECVRRGSGRAVARNNGGLVDGACRRGRATPRHANRHGARDAMQCQWH